MPGADWRNVAITLILTITRRPSRCERTPKRSRRARRTKIQSKACRAENHRPRFLNLINAYTTTASHENARTALARIARSVLAGLTAQGVTKARSASPKEIRRSGLKAVTIATMLVRGKRTGQVTFGRFSVGEKSPLRSKPLNERYRLVMSIRRRDTGHGTKTAQWRQLALGRGHLREVAFGPTYLLLRISIWRT